MFDPIITQLKSLAEITPAADRSVLLDKLRTYINGQIQQQKTVGLHFICTHNSRRSQLGQVWAQAIAAYFGVEANTYSGGTETTRLYPEVAKALHAQGFQIEQLNEGENAITAVKYAPDAPAIMLFSKTYDHFVNPTQNYAAILTCSEADEACPAVPGAAERIALPYADPKAFDSSNDAAAAYLNTSRQIAAELYHIFATLHESK